MSVALVKEGGRRGGRAARKALRSAPPSAELRAVRAGLSGGRYAPLDRFDIEKIHSAALDVLETVGFSRAIPSCVEICAAQGAFLSEAGRLCFPRAMVEDAIAKAGRRFTLHAQNPSHDLEPRDSRVHFGTAGAAVHMVDPRTGAYRESTLADLYDIARVVDALDNIHFFQRSVVARDMADPFDLDLMTCYAAISGTSKHVGSSWVHPAHVEASLEMLHMVAGGERAWRARPFVSMSSCFVVPPMKFAEDACAALEVAVRGGMPVLLLAAGQAGATSPAALAGAVVQQTAEVLGALTWVNCMAPGHPCVFGAWPFVSDLRTGAMSGGSGEQALLMAACAQMAHFYDLPGGVCAGMADSKIPDAQSGGEKAINYALVANAGANMIYEAAGMHASLLGFCLESLVIDDDAIGAALRTVRGVEVDEQTLSVEVIRETCINGPGHFLGSKQTLERMQKDFVYPKIGDRASPKEWAESGSTSAIDRAIVATNEILAEHHPRHIPEALDRAIRSRFDVKLERARMEG